MVTLRRAPVRDVVERLRVEAGVEVIADVATNSVVLVADEGDDRVARSERAVQLLDCEWNGGE